MAVQVKIHGRPGHVGVSLQVRANAVRMGEAEDLCSAMGTYKVELTERRRCRVVLTSVALEEGIEFWAEQGNGDPMPFVWH